VVTIRGIAREAGSRSKIAVMSSDPRVDPIGACVGLRGMRVKNITAELSGERIDIIRYDDDLQTYAANALQPAVIKGIEIAQRNHTLIVHVTPDQARLAFGKRAQNVRLSSKLLGWAFTIVEDVEAVVESFEDKKAKIIGHLAEILDIGPDKATILVDNGFLSLDGLREAGDETIRKIEGIDGDDVDKIMQTLSGE
jgi:N utilization substance protein A